MAEKSVIYAIFHVLRRISTKAKSSANSLEKSLSMCTFVCFDFTSEMRRNISTRKSRNHFYFFVTKKFVKHFKPIRIRNSSNSSMISPRGNPSLHVKNIRPRFKKRSRKREKKKHKKQKKKASPFIDTPHN